MREKTICRSCSAQSRIHRSYEGGRRSFAVPGAAPHYAPDLPFKLEHLLLDVSVDPKAKTLKGTVTQRVKVVAPDQEWIRLDQIGLTVEEVQVGKKSAQFRTEGHALHISLPEANPPKPGETLEFTVRYHLQSSRRGLYFTGPDAEYPKKPYQVWSQGQDEDSRYWFPSFDYPNQKATTEIIATVPKGFTAISNGALLSKSEAGQCTRFHYRLGTPHVLYLVTLVVGEFAEWSDRGPRDLPVQYFVAPGLEENGKRAFGNTPKMIEAFEKKIGIPYPYEKYSQVAVQDFIFGGMENTSATTQTDLTLHDARAHLDFSSDPLVSHELAHQWFGDLLTCRDWSHGWLNEGFATFMERVWIESDTGPNGGLEEAKYYSYQDLKEYLAEDRGRYRRPIVCNTYIEPIDLFDTHLYQKGGLVLNLVRSVLGEDLFWKSINLYATRHRGQNVETLDLIRAIEETTGRNLRRLFDEWVFGAGYPEFEISYQWHEDKKLAELVIEQKQKGENGASGLFHLPATIELTFEDKRKVTHRIELGEARDRVFLAASSKPVMVRFDPNANIPKTMKFPRPKEMLLYQLANDTDCMGRIEATQEVAKIADAEIITALGKAATDDSGSKTPFWGVQFEAAQALATIRMDSARDALIASLKATNPKARKGIAKALGTFKGETVAQALRKHAQKDESYFVEAEATHSFAAAKPQNLEDAEKFLLEQLAKESYREVIRGAALRGLAELPGINRGERPRAVQALIEWTKRGKPMDARMAAIDGLGKIARLAVPAERGRILDLFSDLADEDSFRIRMMLIMALRESEAPEAIPTLQRIKQSDLDGRVKREATASMDALQTAGTAPESVANLKAELEKLQEEQRKLRTMLEETRAQAGAGKG